MAELFERAWPVADAKGAVAIVHGLAEHSGRYDHVARTLNAAGYAAYGVDLPGHGNSPGFPGDMGDDFGAAVRDVTAFVTRIKAAHERTFLLAHSMGTLFALPTAIALPVGTLSGLVLSGVAVMPGEAVIESISSGQGVPADLISHDAEIVQAYKDDPLVFYDRVPNELFGMAGEATAAAIDAIGKVGCPVLLMHGTEDKLCSLEGANHVHVQLVVTDKTLKVYRGLYHEVLNEVEREQVKADLVAWLDER